MEQPFYDHAIAPGAPPKPEALLVQANNIPRRIRRLKRWLLWRYEFIDGRWTKVPYGTDGYRLKWGNPKNLLTFKEAIAAYRNDPSLDGIGFVFMEGDNITGIDWDVCIDDQGDVEQWAQLDLADFEHTYIERSPSNSGFHALGLGTTPHNGFKKWKQPRKEKDPGVEIYCKGRWFAVTGHVIGDSKELVDCQSAINSFHKKYFAQSVPLFGQAGLKHNNSNGHDDPEDAEILAAIAKIPPKVDEAELVKALVFVPADDRHKWLNTLHAIKHTKLDNAYDIAYAYSKKSKKFNPAEWPEIWDGLKPDGSYQVRSIFYEAIQRGYSYPKNYTVSENGLASQFADSYRHKLRWCPDFKKWLFYDDIRWVKDINGELAQKCAREFTESLYKELGTCDDDRRRNLTRHLANCNSARVINAVVGLSKSDLLINANQLDRDPYLLNVNNGTVDLRTGKLLPHNPEHFITKLAPIDFDANATCPRFDQFLMEIFLGSTAVIDFELTWFGYGLTGSVEEHIMAIHHGYGRNGKSTLLKLVIRMLGNYARQCPSSILLMKNKIGGISEDVAGLNGIRTAATSELNKRIRLDTAKLRALVGGDRRNCERKFEHEIEYEPTDKMNLLVNDLPIIDDAYAVTSKVINLFYGAKFVDEPENDPGYAQGNVFQKDPKLDDKLFAEAPGILNRLIEGCLRWQKEGLKLPAEVKKSTAAYKDSMNILNQFINDQCEKGNNKQVGAKKLYDKFKNWCKENDEPAISIVEFKNQMLKRNFKREDKTAGGFWLGIAICDDSSDAQDAFETVEAVTTDDNNDDDIDYTEGL